MNVNVRGNANGTAIVSENGNENGNASEREKGIGNGNGNVNGRRKSSGRTKKGEVLKRCPTIEEMGRKRKVVCDESAKIVTVMVIPEVTVLQM